MCALLDLHDDEAHKHTWRTDMVRGDSLPNSSPPEHTRKHRMLEKGVARHLHRLCQTLELPSGVKELFQKPADESKSFKLEEFRTLLVKPAEREALVDLPLPMR